MGHEFPAEVLEVGPDTVGPGAGHDRDLDPDPALDDRHPTIVYSNDAAGRLRRAMLLSAPLLRRGAQRARRPPRRPDRADGRRAARRQPVRHRRRRGRAGARLRPGRAGRDRRAAAAGHRATSWPPTSPSARRAMAPTMGAHEAVDPRRRAGLRRVATRRWRPPGLVVFEAIGVPGIIDDALRLAPRRRPHRRGRRVHAARHDHAVLRDQQGAQRAASRSATTRWSSPTAAPHRRGRDRRGADDHRRGRPRRRGRRVRGSWPTPTSTARSSWCRNSCRPPAGLARSAIGARRTEPTLGQQAFPGSRCTCRFRPARSARQSVLPHGAALRARAAAVDHRAVTASDRGRSARASVPLDRRRGAKPALADVDALTCSA